MTEKEIQKMHQELWEEQKCILGETDENLDVFVTDEQLIRRRKMLFDFRKEYLGNEKPVNKITPLVSVCIPTYQHKNYIEQCLTGALMQKTNFLYEIIICDDGSTDGAVEICRSYAEKYPDKIRLYDHNRAMTRLFDSNGNAKKGLNWWWTLESARGKYIALCEGDDYWTDPLKLQKQVDFLEANPEYGLVHTETKYFIERDKKLKEINRRKVPVGDIFKALLIRGNFLTTCTVLYRTDLLQCVDFSYQEKMFKMGDYPLWLELSRHTKFHYMYDVTAVYRVYAGSASYANTYAETIAFREDVYEVKKYFHSKYPNNIDFESVEYLPHVELWKRAVRFNIQEDIVLYSKYLPDKTVKQKIQKYLLGYLRYKPIRSIALYIYYRLLRSRICLLCISNCRKIRKQERIQ
jgi:glycosyltransferase involved in cell wall biosynthesis